MLPKNIKPSIEKSRSSSDVTLVVTHFKQDETKEKKSRVEKIEVGVEQHECYNKMNEYFNESYV